MAWVDFTQTPENARRRYGPSRPFWRLPGLPEHRDHPCQSTERAEQHSRPQPSLVSSLKTRSIHTGNSAISTEARTGSASGLGASRTARNARARNCLIGGFQFADALPRHGSANTTAMMQKLPKWPKRQVTAQKRPQPAGNIIGRRLTTPKKGLTRTPYLDPRGPKPVYFRGAGWHRAGRSGRISPRGTVAIRHHQRGRSGKSE